MSEYLFEIGTEELPASVVAEALVKLKELLVDELVKLNVAYSDVTVLGTPRRLAVLLSGLEAVQKTVSKKVKGPPVKTSFDANGQPTAAAIGFAQKQGLEVGKLDRETISGVEYLIANVSLKGRPTAEVLSELIPKLVDKMPAERPMRWASSDFKFSRPIRWMISLLDSEVVPLEINGVKAGNQSQGHRILAPGPVTIRSATSYAQDLAVAKVMVEPGKRRKTILEAVAKAASSVNGIARQIDGALLEEVIHLNEWPVAILGNFASEYLELPDHLIETVMVHHQRYFPVQTNEAKHGLLPHFISIANNDLKPAAAKIQQGNERVLKARLADARFFYLDDQKISLPEREAALKQLTFQEGLGTYADKQARMISCSGELTKNLNLDKQLTQWIERTIALCKFDLVTNLVCELPELQGCVGSWYAKQWNEPVEVIAAINSHYGPRFNEDHIPQDKVGCFVAVIDKLDNLVGFFALGKRPTGSGDPFALRRQAQGIIDILFDGLSEYAIDILGLAKTLLNQLKPFLDQLKRKVDTEVVLKELQEFLDQRIRLKLAHLNYSREVIEAVMSAEGSMRNLSDTLMRCKVLAQLIDHNKNVDVIRSGVRVGNIINEQSKGEVVESALTTEPERILYAVFQADVVKPWSKIKKAKTTLDDYEQLVGMLFAIAKPLDAFFETVMVNDPDLSLKKNRHALLFDINQYFSKIGDFTKLQTVLL